jgi:hypothetical protein
MNDRLRPNSIEFKRPSKQQIFGDTENKKALLLRKQDLYSI